MTLASKMPASELPRERLLRDGIDALSLQELIAILLRTGTEGKPVLILAQELLLQFGGVEGLLHASVEELTRVKGIGEAKAVLLKAAFGIALRASKEKNLPHKPLLTVQDILSIAVPAIGYLKKEAFLVILRDIKCRLIHQEIISIGTISEVLVHPREVFQLAVRYGAYSMVVCHNHPSGDPLPSKADITLTNQLLECAKLMGIILSDHIIISGEKYHSIKNASCLDKKRF